MDARVAAPPEIEAFIAYWQGREGGQERANYVKFFEGFCRALDLPAPQPADASVTGNDYVYERAVRDSGRDGSVSVRRIDLYKRGCFVLEAKQSRQQAGNSKEIQLTLLPPEPAVRGRRSADRAWDVLMQNARRQAEDYVRLLPPDHVAPPFIITCDVGHCFELYANFRGDGKAYEQFPDRQGFRIYLEDLRQEEVRRRFKAIWTDPRNLDPTLRSAEVTRNIAERLAAVSRALEAKSFPADQVAMFLMRCLFTMFAEDVGLLPPKAFHDLLQDCEAHPDLFPSLVEDLWQAMNDGTTAAVIRKKVRRFNGAFFVNSRALPLGREEIGELRQAASHDWRGVEPAIFGTLLEQALDPAERRRLGAHYTPRAYVERLVQATIIEPLREDWVAALATAERQKADGREKDAAKTIANFHDRLCKTEVLDPACGTGNFLYVSLELMKRLEGEVLEALADLGGQEALHGLEGHGVDPHQFHGIEINPRAAAIAELVLWIGYLQWHFRIKGGVPGEPILKSFKNIKHGDAVLTWDGDPRPRAPDLRKILPNPRRPCWPPADFIIGNPPFIGASALRSRLGDAYAEALWAAHPLMNDSADFVMYWWDRAADLLTLKGTRLRRFGFVTTNSISQVLQRRVLERHLSAKKPVALVMAIPDHPWRGTGKDNASVRIAMTVAEAGSRQGRLRDVTQEKDIDTDVPIVDFIEIFGAINSDLTVGPALARTKPLQSNANISHDGVKLHGAGFIVSPPQAEMLGAKRRPGLEAHVHPYRNGRDLASRPRGLMVIDLFGLDADTARKKSPEVYQHILTNVKPERDRNNRNTYRDNWWIFGEPRREMRLALYGLRRYIVTVDTARHRVFQFISSKIICDDKCVIVASDDAFALGVLSSRFHVVWATRAGGWLGAGNDSVYTKTRTFDPFPFPIANENQKKRIRLVAEDLDTHRKRVLDQHPHLTLTGLYNVIERLRAGVSPAILDSAERRIFDDGLVLILKELHDKLDEAVAATYGWPVDLSDVEILAHLVELNQERTTEEAKGQVRWLRPDYQVPRFGSAKERAEQVEATLVPAAAQAHKPSFPAADIEQTAAVMAALMDTAVPVDAVALASRFRQGKRAERKVSNVLLALARVGVIAQANDGRGFIMSARL
jgi:hypothetical protein